jgi:hypothetical protein
MNAIFDSDLARGIAAHVLRDEVRSIAYVGVSWNPREGVEIQVPLQDAERWEALLVERGFVSLGRGRFLRLRTCRVCESAPAGSDDLCDGCRAAAIARRLGASHLQPTRPPPRQGGGDSSYALFARKRPSPGRFDAVPVRRSLPERQSPYGRRSARRESPR